jgi:hypothetical protein
MQYMEHEQYLRKEAVAPVLAPIVAKALATTTTVAPFVHRALPAVRRFGYKMSPMLHRFGGSIARDAQQLKVPVKEGLNQIQTGLANYYNSGASSPLVSNAVKNAPEAVQKISRPIAGATNVAAKVGWGYATKYPHRWPIISQTLNAVKNPTIKTLGTGAGVVATAPLTIVRRLYDKYVQPTVTSRPAPNYLELTQAAYKMNRYRKAKGFPPIASKYTQEHGPEVTYMPVMRGLGEQ